MVTATVGGRPFDFTREQIEDAMRGVSPEMIREHVVEMLNSVYPPKQVLATVTGWDRQSFTTMEAQRVLRRAGFQCRRVGKLADGRTAWFQLQDERTEEVTNHDGQVPPSSPMEIRLAQTEAAVAVANLAISELTARLARLERG